MKTMMFYALALVPAFCLAAALTECAADEPKFEGKATQADAIGIAKGFSDDGQAVTLIFDNLLVHVGGSKYPLVNTRTLSIAIPIESKDQDVYFSQDIRGFVSVDAGARAALVVQAAGKTSVVHLHEAKDEPTAGDAACEARERADKQAEDFEEDDEPADGFDFLHRIDGKLPAGMSYRVTFFLLVERDSDSADVGAYLAVDTLDIEIGKPKKQK